MKGADMKNIAIIPARSGSKGLKDKNIKELMGIPLLAYSIDAAKASGLFDEIMVSTDSRHYADIAVRYGASVPFLRSKERSGDNAGSWDVAEEVLRGYLKAGRAFDTVCLLQPTSPLRKAEDIVRGYELFGSKNADAVTAVCETEHSPLWCMTLPDNLSLAQFREGVEEGVPRQQLEKYYRINGALYIRKVKYEDGQIVLCSKDEYALIMERSRSVDIDEELDFRLARCLLENTGMQA